MLWIVCKDRFPYFFLASVWYHYPDMLHSHKWIHFFRIPCAESYLSPIHKWAARDQRLRMQVSIINSGNYDYTASAIPSSISPLTLIPSTLPAAVWAEQLPLQSVPVLDTGLCLQHFSFSCIGRQAAAFMYEYVELALVIEAAARLSLQLEEGCFLPAAANKGRETSKQGGYGLLFHL